jgi:geranylgeranyl diphosphate synthase type I
MQSTADVRNITPFYTSKIDAYLQQVFDSAPDLPMYDHLAYFMGFKNEQLQTEVVYGGKRFRSSLLLMLGDWYGQLEPALPFAGALELYHNFTLIHDDVVDKDTHRRGRPTVWHLFGSDHAINDGDAQHLMMAEILAAAAEGSAAARETQRFLLKQFRTVVEGQYLDFALTTATLGDAEVNQAAYEEMIRRKTAELIVAAAQGAGILAGQSEAECQLLKTYAQSLGMAYQMCDDVVSIWATSETTGKRNYGDIKEKKKTLPILFAYEQLAAAEKAQLAQLYSQAELSDADCETVITLLDSVGTKPAMEISINEYATKAKTAAQALTLTADQRDTLCCMVDSLLPKV